MLQSSDLCSEPSKDSRKPVAVLQYLWHEYDQALDTWAVYSRGPGFPFVLCNPECMLNSKQMHNSRIFFLKYIQNNLNSIASTSNLAATLQEQLLICFSNCFCKPEISLKFSIITSCISAKLSEAWEFSEKLNVYSSGTEISMLQAVSKSCKTKTKPNFSCLSFLLKDNQVLLKINKVLNLKTHFIFSR